MLTENAISISAGRGFTAELKCAHVGYGAASHALWLKIARWPYAAVLNISGWTQERQLKFLGCEICLCWSRVEFLIQTECYAVIFSSNLPHQRENRPRPT